MSGASVANTPNTITTTTANHHRFQYCSPNNIGNARLPLYLALAFSRSPNRFLRILNRTTINPPVLRTRRSFQLSTLTDPAILCTYPRSLLVLNGNVVLLLYIIWTDSLEFGFPCRVHPSGLEATLHLEAIVLRVQGGYRVRAVIIFPIHIDL